MNGYGTLLIWVVVIGAVFAVLWWNGYLLRLANYTAETREELKKCTWPSVDELKGSTVVVMITIALMGLFTVCIDFILSLLMRLLT